MNFKGFDLNLLTALDALLNERSVTRAAEQLHVTQPAMSNALQRIRLTLGDPILERSGRELKLTPVGEGLVEPVRDLLQRASQLLGITDAFEPATATRTFRIAMSDYCATVFLPHFVKTLFEEAPFVHCAVEPLNERSYERLCARNIDFCISAQDILLMDIAADASRVNRTELFRDTFTSAIRVGHPAAGARLTEDIFLKCGHIGYRSGIGVRSLEEQATQNLGFDVDIRITTPTLGAMPRVIVGTDLIATFPLRLVETLGNFPEIQLSPCPIAIPQLVETLFWHPLAETDLGHQWMKDLLLRSGARLPEPP